MLDIANVTILFDGKEIVRDLSLHIPSGELHVLMGPNGAGKSSLARWLAGHPQYETREGTCAFCGENFLDTSPDVRARKGLFLSFQNPLEIPGVGAEAFLRAAWDKLSRVGSFDAALSGAKQAVGLKEECFRRGLYEGFSGGEKKRFELLEMLLFQPKLAIFDEIDSGLDIDALKMVGTIVREFVGGERSALLITHNPKLLRYLVPDVIHIMVDGRCVASGGAELAAQLERRGFASFVEGA